MVLYSNYNKNQDQKKAFITGQAKLNPEHFLIIYVGGW